MNSTEVQAQLISGGTYFSLHPSPATKNSVHYSPFTKKRGLPRGSGRPGRRIDLRGRRAGRKETPAGSAWGNAGRSVARPRVGGTHWGGSRASPRGRRFAWGKRAG